MTDLTRLYDAIDGRTKGKWEAGLDFVHITDPDGGFASMPCDPKDSTFIALMGSCADEIKAVLQAVETIKVSRDPEGCLTHEEYVLDQAIETLAAKLQECGK